MWVNTEKTNLTDKEPIPLPMEGFGEVFGRMMSFKGVIIRPRSYL